jgi:hypothetical protein
MIKLRETQIMRHLTQLIQMIFRSEPHYSQLDREQKPRMVWMRKKWEERSLRICKLL